VVTADFSKLAVGQSVEGLGVVAPGLNIDAKGTAAKVMAGVQPLVYYAPNVASGSNINGAMNPNGGFSDTVTQSAVQAHQYTFTFAPGMTVTNFSLHMLDYGDWNPTLSTSHYVSMIAYDVNGNVVSKQEISYETLADVNPRSSAYGDLWFAGDAVAPFGQLGNWVWNVSGDGIVKVVLNFGVGYDPNIAFDLLSYTKGCLSCQAFRTSNLSQLTAGQSVEGLNVVAPGLNIDAKGTAVKVMAGVQPLVYYAPNVATVNNTNQGLDARGGFSDVVTQSAVQAHQYTFSFAPGMTITNFSVQMHDYGDWNPTLSTSHYVSMIAYDANGNIVSKEEISYSTLAEVNPRSSSYGDLWYTGDAVAPLGQLGNWIWNISGNGITKVVLTFGAGYDPNIAFDLLSYNVVCP
jgi:hypothetical protein